MRLVPTVLGVCLLTSCTLGEPPPAPPVAPMPEDLSTWTVPEMLPDTVQQRPLPQRLIVPEPPPTPAERVYTYAPGKTYAVPVAIGFPLDIVLGRGELVHNVTDGDRSPQGDTHTRRWHVHQGVEGTGGSQRQHIFVTVPEAGLTNGLVITTTRRTYYITLESVTKSPVRVLRWKEDPEPVEMPEPHEALHGPLPAFDVPTSYHVGYVVASQQQPAPDWMVQGAWDDGKKLYLQLPITTLYGVAPLVRAIGPNGPMLVNVRQYLNYYIIDQLAPRLELRVGIGDHAEVVSITRGPLRTIRCPGDSACPQWPEAAHHLSRRPS